MIKKLKWIKRLKKDLKRKQRIIEMQHSRIETLEWDLKDTQAELLRREREMIECTKRVVDMAAKIEKETDIVAIQSKKIDQLIQENNRLHNDLVQ